MKEWTYYKLDQSIIKLDQSIIVYSVRSGKVHGGSNPNRTIKKVKKYSNGYYCCDGVFTMELDPATRSLVIWINNKKIILDGNIGDFQFSPIVISSLSAPEVTLLNYFKKK